jgi:hypothetical protein
MEPPPLPRHLPRRGGRWTRRKKGTARPTGDPRTRSCAAPVAVAFSPKASRTGAAFRVSTRNAARPSPKPAGRTRPLPCTKPHPPKDSARASATARSAQPAPAHTPKQTHPQPSLATRCPRHIAAHAALDRGRAVPEGRRRTCSGRPACGSPARRIPRAPRPGDRGDRRRQRGRQAAPQAQPPAQDARQVTHPLHLVTERAAWRRAGAGGAARERTG